MGICFVPQASTSIETKNDYPLKNLGGHVAVTWWSKKKPRLFYQFRAEILVAGAGFEPTTSGL